MKKKKKNNNLFRNIFLFLIIVFLVLVFIYFRAINTSAGTGEDQDFIIQKGDRVSLISENLKKNNLIKSELIFNLYTRFSGQQTDFKEGLYILNPGMNIKEIVEKLTPRISLRPEEWLTFIEGWNLNDYARVLEERGLVDSDDFFALVGKTMIRDDNLKDYSLTFSFLKDKPDDHNLEGYLFPDTYRFFHDSSLDFIIKKMLLNFDKKLSLEMRAEIDKQGKSIHEIVTMASIIEKEVQSEEDMKVVSGIFWNRIENNRALESCATLAYVLGENKDQYSYEDTRVDSSYNTYINRGLPPGPIANPGIKAIEAAIYPENTSYNYFLSNPETGETIFSRTYEEHLSNKNKYIR